MHGSLQVPSLKSPADKINFKFQKKRLKNLITLFAFL